MGKSTSAIQINGKRFATRPDGLIDSPFSTRTIDSFRRLPSMPLSISKTVSKKVRPHKAVTPIKHIAHKRFKKPAEAIHSRQMHSKILRRSIVKKPIKAKSKVDKPRFIKAKPLKDKVRLSKALHVAKSTSVSRFGNPVNSGKAIPMPVNAAFVQPKPATALQSAPSVAAGASHNRLERILDEALLRADAHSKHKAKPHKFKQMFKKRRWLVLVCLLVVTVLAAGMFLAWRSLPQLSMGVASIRSDIKGSIPSYAPSGFKFAGPIEYSKKSLSMQFNDKQGNSYQITESPSNLSSSALEDNDVPHSSQIQSSQVKGTTVYIYDKANNATWVNNGVKYTIKNKAKLGSDEILKIADSL